MSARILVVDDERTLRRIVVTLLSDAGYAVADVEGGDAALDHAPAFRPDLVLLDLRMPGRNGIETMVALQERLAPECPVFVMMTAHGSIHSAVDAMKKGAGDYITKPFDNEELQLVVQRALEKRILERRVDALESQLDERFRPQNMIGLSSSMGAVFQTIGRVAPLVTSVLITGETGTGKELVARAIHRASPRRSEPFVAVNCGAIPASLMETTFFGHEKGAFTDAKTAARGAFEQADQGTIFLDEVGELSAQAQAGLLRTLQEREIRRVGGERTVTVDVRVIAATNRDLHAEVEAGRFREDLLWRLNVVALHIAPLRERPGDIPALVDHFIAKHAARLRIPAKSVSLEALSLLLAYDWPGNVRELENAIEHALALSTGSEISSADFPYRIGRGQSGGTASIPGSVKVLAPTLAEAVARAQHALERRMIEEALRSTGGNRALAAEVLGVSRKTLFNKMRDLMIEAPE